MDTTIKTYKPLTIKEVANILCENSLIELYVGNEEKGPFRLFVINGIDFKNKTFICKSGAATYSYKYCFELIEADPFETPEGVPDIPQELSDYIYIGTGKDNENREDCPSQDYKYSFSLDTWSKDVSKSDFSENPDCHFIINAKSDYAKKHFPEIVEAFEKRGFQQWLDSTDMRLTPSQEKIAFAAFKAGLNFSK